jgi:hypothetical protein
LKPEEQKTNNVPDTYTVSFQVKLQFEEASNMIFKYPVIIDDVPLASNLIPEIRSNDTPIASTQPAYRNGLWNFSYYGHTAALRRDEGTVVCPFYDDWVFPWNDLFHKGYRPFFISIFTADTSESGIATIDLKKPLYEDVCLHPLILYVLKEQGEESFQHDCLINISAWRRNREQFHGDLHLSKDLILTIKAKDPHAQKHLVISEVSHYRFVHTKWFYIVNQFQGSVPSDWTIEDENGNWSTGTSETVPSWCLKQQFPEWFTTGGKDPYGSYRTIRIFRAALRPRGAGIRSTLGRS